MMKLIKKIAYYFGFELKRVKDKHPILFNVFNTTNQKRVLISYLKEPFLTGKDLKHSNKFECYTAAEIFSELGYQVDVINLYANTEVNFDEYDVIYGQGPVFERSFYCENKIKRIFYATGCNVYFSDIESAKKIRQFYFQKNTLCLNSGRLANFTLTLSVFLSDKVIVLGNKFVLNTFTRFDNLVERYTNLNAFFFDVYDIDLEKKDFSKAKKHFLWFGSYGLLHKGLDVAIEVFSKRENLVLHICGADFDFEKKFFDYYSTVLSKCDNIVNHGFVDLESNEFKNLMEFSAFVIFPSVSEGGAVALLNVMANGGLIPIISKSTGLDIGNLGWQQDECSYDSFNEAIIVANKTDPTRLKQMAIELKSEIRENYTIEKYRNNLKNIINLTLS
ncbi:MAG: glycosyltransferase [Bacteroidota bacterium]